MEIKKNYKIIIASICLAVSLGFCLYNAAMFIVLPNEEEAKVALEEAKMELEASRNLENCDEATKTLNRKGFEEFLGNFMKEANKGFSEKQAALYALSFNSSTRGLKAVNDQFGHLAGNELPVAFVDCLRKVFDDERFVFSRRSGSAFIILDTNYAGKEDFATRVKSLKKIWHDSPFKLNDKVTLEKLALHAFALPFDAKNETRSPEELADFAYDEIKKVRDLASFTLSFDGDETPVTSD